MKNKIYLFFTLMLPFIVFAQENIPIRPDFGPGDHPTHRFATSPIVNYPQTPPASTIDSYIYYLLGFAILLIVYAYINYIFVKKKIK